MDDLIEQLQSYDLMKPHIAKREFDKSLFSEDGKYHIIVGYKETLTAFLYTQKIIKRNIVGYCFNHLTPFGFQDHLSLINKYCRTCKQFTVSRFVNNTGIPSDKNCASSFYTYWNRETQHEVSNKLVIVQLIDKSIERVNTLEVEYNITKGSRLYNHIKWLYYYDVILVLTRIDLIPDLKNYILMYSVSL